MSTVRTWYVCQWLFVHEKESEQQAIPDTVLADNELDDELEGEVDNAENGNARLDDHDLHGWLLVPAHESPVADDGTDKDEHHAASGPGEADDA